MSPDDEWAAWARDFRDGGDPAPSPDAMLAAARREARRQRLAYAAELLACAVLVAFYAVMSRRVREAWFAAMAAANFAFAALWMGYLTHVRRGTWGAVGRDAQAFAALARARRAADLRWYRVSRGMTAAMLLFVAAWAPLMVRARWSLYVAEPWRAVVGFGVAALVGAAVLVAQTRGIHRAARALKALDEA